MLNNRQTVITLTTDFGTSDWYVGTMKGVILNISPNAKIVDITHEIPQGDIRAAAFSLLCSYKYFPKGTIHVVVVDPTVGSNRKPIAIKTDSYWFIAPDNGALSYAAMNEKIQDIRLIENERFLLKRKGNTFHGRDVFAPIAAHIAKGKISPSKIGKRLSDYIKLDYPKTEQKGNEVAGKIIYIDRFGNCITNIEFKDESEYLNSQIFIGNKKIATVCRCYADVESGAPVAVFGSSGFIEIAIRDGNAAKKLNLQTGAKIRLKKPL